MGFAIANEARQRGAKVTLISGPVNLPTPEGVHQTDVVTAQEMFETCKKHFSQNDVFIATAAIGDYRPQKIHPQKIKKSSKELNIKLLPNEDILLNLGRKKKRRQIVVGFAAETKDWVKNAKKKIAQKNLDLIIANDVSGKKTGFESDFNQVILIDKEGNTQKFPKMSKSEVARKILDRIEIFFQQK